MAGRATALAELAGVQVRTIDVRLLVRGDLTDDQILESLRAGSLRVHAVAPLETGDEAVAGDVRYAPRTYAQLDWTGEPLDHDVTRGDARGHAPR